MYRIFIIFNIKNILMEESGWGMNSLYCNRLHKSGYSTLDSVFLLKGDG